MGAGEKAPEEVIAFTGDDHTRDRIADAALRLITAHDGENEVTVRMIAAEAGINVSLISYYFGGKEGLLVSLFDSGVAQLVKRRKAGFRKLHADVSLEEILEAFLQPLVKLAGSEKDVIWPLWAYMKIHHGALYARLFAERYDFGSAKLIDILCVKLRHLSRTEIAWRLHAFGGSFTAVLDPIVYSNLDRLTAEPPRARSR